MLVVDGREVTRVEVAASRHARRVGLLGRPGCDHALWLPGTRSVHTRGMRFTMEAAWLDRSGRVQRVSTLPPGRMSMWMPMCAGIIETEAGNFAKWGLAKGSQVNMSRLHLRRKRRKPRPVNSNITRREARKFRRRSLRGFRARRARRIDRKRGPKNRQTL